MITSIFFKQSEKQAVAHKDDKTPVTMADLAAHKVIVAGLKKIQPSIPVISEEESVPSFETRRSWQQYWLVDPLDGTRGFIRHSDEFTVNIAFIDRGKSVLGVIVQPVTGDCFYAIDGKPVYYRNRAAQPTPLSVDHSQSNNIRALCGHFDRSMHYIESIIPSDINIEFIKRNSSIKFAALAQGLGDVYCRYGPTSEWDTAAGQCILEAAGGAVVDFEGKALQYNTKNSLNNPSFLAVRNKVDLPYFLALIDSLRRKK